MNLDDRLRHSLRREPGPADLAERVLARAASEASARPSQERLREGRGSPVRPWLAVAACALIAAGAARAYVVQTTSAEAERATAKVRMALEITSEKLALVQRRIQYVRP